MAPPLKRIREDPPASRPPLRPLRGHLFPRFAGARKLAHRQPMRRPRHQAVVAAGHAGAADIGAEIINATGRMFAHLSGERRTSAALAAHSGLVGRYQLGRNAIELLVVLGREARPVGRVGAAGAAALAVEDRDRAGILVDRHKDLASQAERPGRDGCATGVPRQGRYFFLVLRAGASAGDLNRSVATSGASGFAAGLAGLAVAGGAAGRSLAENFMAMSVLVRKAR